MKTSTRRKGRECALQILYLLETTLHKNSSSPQGTVNVNGLDKEVIATYVRDFFANFLEKPEIIDHTTLLVEGVVHHGTAIDALISKHSTKWKIERMVRVDRNAMRIAIFELLFQPTIPGRVIIDEAIEIAKKYGTENSAAFVNGILDQIGKQQGRI